MMVQEEQQSNFKHLPSFVPKKASDNSSKETSSFKHLPSFVPKNKAEEKKAEIMPDWKANVFSYPAGLGMPKEQAQAARGSAKQYFQQPTDVVPEEGKDESKGKQTLRGALQGIEYGVNKFTKGAQYTPDIIEHVARTGAIASFDELKREHPDINRESYDEAVNNASSYIPTYSKAKKAVEDMTGIPLQAKTYAQKALLFLFSTAGLGEGGIASDLATGTGATVVAEKLKEMGVNDTIADTVGASFALKVQPIASSQISQYNNLMSKVNNPQFESPPPGGFPEDAPPPPPVNPNALVPRTAPGTPPPQQSKAAALFTPYDVAKKVKEMIPEPPPYSKEPRLQKPPEEVKYLLPEEVPMLPKETIEKASGAKSVENLYDPTFAHNEIGNAISQQKPLPKVTGGKYLVHTLEDIEVPVRERISGVKLPDGRREGGVYAQARELMAGNTYADPPFSRYLLSEKDRLENMPAGTRSSPQNKLLKSINGILSKTNALSSDELTGNITYGPVIPVDSQLMIDIQQNLQDVVNYDFAGKEPTAIFKPLINRIEKHLEDATKGTNAYPALKHANSVYKRSWAEPFLNEKLLPFRNESKDTNLVSLYEKATNDYDTFRALQKALKIGKEEGGDVIEKLLKRDLVQNKLSPYIKNPKLIGSPEFQKEILDLKTILSKDEFRKVIENLNLSKKVQNQISKTKREAKKAQAEIVAHKEAVRVRAATAKNIERAQKEANMSLQEKAAEINKEKKRLHKEYSEKYEKEHGVKTKILSMTPEQISKHASTISGLEEIEKLLSEIEGGDKAYDLLTSIQSKELLSKGKVEGTAEDVLEVISNTENRRYLVKTLGAPNVREIQVIAKNQIKLTELLKRKYEQLDKIEVPKKWTHKLNSWAKIRREALMAAAHPSHFLENLAKGWANDGVTKEQILANNKELREGLEYINSQLEELEKLKK